MKILLTGFEAFGTVVENPTQILVEAMAHSNDLSDHIELVCAVLPVSYDTVGPLVRELIARHQPDAVVMLGVASSRDAINLEYHAANCDTSTHPDNCGVTRTNLTIDPRFDHYFKRPSTLPLDYLYCELRAHDIPVKRSYDAGGYLCNHSFYHAITYVLEDYDKPARTGFIHIPTFEKIDRTCQLFAIHRILNAIGDPAIDEKQYRHPLIQARLEDVFAKMPENPDWCSLISVGGLHVAHAGHDEPADKISALTVATEALGDRFLTELAEGEFGYCIWGNKSGIFLVADLQVIPYLFVIKWSDEGSLSSVYLTSKALPQAIKPLVELLN